MRRLGRVGVLLIVVIGSAAGCRKEASRDAAPPGPAAPEPAGGGNDAVAPGDASAAAPADAVAPPSAEAAAPTDAAAAPADAGSPERRALDERARQYRRALRDGRELSRAARYDEAMARLREALVADPQDPVARCELAWAAFQKPDLGTARVEIAAALRDFERRLDHRSDPRLLKLLGGCLYNAGRVAEEDGDRPAAVAFYRRSVAVRPHESVQSRLDLLEASAPAADPPLPAPSDPPARPDLLDGGKPLVARTLEELEPLIVQRHCEAALYEGAAADALEGCLATGRTTRSLRENPGPPFAAGVVIVESSSPDLGMLLEAWVVLQAADGWHALGALAADGASGVGGTSAEIDPGEVEFGDWIAGGAPEVRIGVRTRFHDTDMGFNEVNTWTREVWGFCGLDGEKPICWGRVVLAESARLECLFDPGDLPEEDRAMLRQMGAECIDPAFTGREEGYAVSVEPAPPDRVRILSASGTPPAWLLGEFPLRALPAPPER